MDSRVYFHQYRRPRYQNPTYKSSNVQNSITFFNGHSGYNEPRQARQSERRTIDASYSKAPTPPPSDTYRFSKEQPSSTRYGQPSQSQQHSKLSNYGKRSLQLDQRGVYQKQLSPYNIVNLKPKEYNSGIRQYPWLSMQNRDDVFYRRMNDQYKEKDFYNSSKERQYLKTTTEQVIAGKHTYDMEPKTRLNPQTKHKGHFTAKMLNHMDELQHNLS